MKCIKTTIKLLMREILSWVNLSYINYYLEAKLIELKSNFDYLKLSSSN